VNDVDRMYGTMDGKRVWSEDGGGGERAVGGLRS